MELIFGWDAGWDSREIFHIAYVGSSGIHE